jgi:predicted nucleotidyltransferase component of viral defense system
MIQSSRVRQFANSQSISLETAYQEIVLHYLLNLLHEGELIGRSEDGDSYPLLFKGGTALRKCFFGSSGRFSEDIDLDAVDKSDFESAIEELFAGRSPYHGINFSFSSTRWSDDANENFSGTVHYETPEAASGTFELQISYRMQPILDPRVLILQPQSYHKAVEFQAPALWGLDPYEMIAEKIVACNRRQGGSAKDVYDLWLWSARPFNDDLIRGVTVCKAWSDQRSSNPFDPEAWLAILDPSNFRWEDLNGLIPKSVEFDKTRICETVRSRLGFLQNATDLEKEVLADQVAHRVRAAFDELSQIARDLSESAIRP